MRTFENGSRVRVNGAVSPGMGKVPNRGDRGTVESQREDGTVLVKLDDGRRALLAAWELELVEDGN